MEPEDHIVAAGVPASRTVRDGFAVADDLAGLPVTAAEIDVVEAFLMAKFRDLMAGEVPANAGVLPPGDSQMPQSHADMRPMPKRRRVGR